MVGTTFVCFLREYIITIVSTTVVVIAILVIITLGIIGVATMIATTNYRP
jgi:hypothetical protein